MIIYCRILFKAHTAGWDKYRNVANISLAEKEYSTQNNTNRIYL